MTARDLQRRRLVDEGTAWDDRRLNLLGLQGGGTVKRGVSAIHHMVWKHIIPEMVRTDEKKGDFQTEAVQERAAKRFKKREEAMTVEIKLHKLQCEARGRMFDPRRFNQRLDGIAEVTEEGNIVKADGLKQWLKKVSSDGGEEETEEADMPVVSEGRSREDRKSLYQCFVRGDPNGKE